MRLIKLSPSQRVQGRWLAQLEDNTLLRLGEGEVVSFGLYAGMELTPDTLAALDKAARGGRLREKALGLIARRPMSRRELVERLTRPPRDAKSPPVPLEEAEAVADRLEELGYLDDRAYARQVAEQARGKGYGARRIRDELYRRGVPREFWEEALEDLPSPQNAIDAFVQKRLAGWDGDQRALKRVADALARRGYGWEEIRDALERYRASLDE